MNSQKFYFSYKKLLALFLASACLFIGGIVMVLEGEIVGYFCLSVGAIFTLISIILFIPGRFYLLLSKEHLEISLICRKEKIEWKDFREISILSQSFFSKQLDTSIGYKRVSNSKKAKTLCLTGKPNETFKGIEGSIPNLFRIKTEELFDLMVKNFELPQKT